jgi:hypothetical protein
MRKILIAAGAALMLVASVPTVASAQFFGWGGGYYSRGFVGPRFFRPRFGFRFGAPFAYGAFAGCNQLRRVWTPFGWRWRRVWVC